MNCPCCGAVVPEARSVCQSCGLDLGSDDARRLTELASNISALRREGGEIVARVKAQQSTVRSVAYTKLSQPTAPDPQLTEFVKVPAAAMKPVAPTAEASRRSVRDILLWLGASLCCLAAILFVAVTWSHLSVNSRAGIMLSVTALFAVAGHVLYGKKLTATGEALMTTAIGFIIIDIASAHALGFLGLDSVDGALYWAWSIMALVAALSAYRAFVPMISPPLIAVIGAQIPLFLMLIGFDADSTPIVVALIGLQVLALLQIDTIFKKHATLAFVSTITLGSAIATYLLMALVVVAGTLVTSIDGSGYLDWQAAFVISALVSAAAGYVGKANGSSWMRASIVATVVLVALSAIDACIYFISGEAQFAGFAACGLLLVAASKLLKRFEPRSVGHIGLATSAVGVLALIGAISLGLLGPITWLFDSWNTSRQQPARDVVAAGIDWNHSIWVLMTLLLGAAALAAKTAVDRSRNWIPALSLGAIAMALTPLSLDLRYDFALAGLTIFAIAALMTTPFTHTESVRNLQTVVGFGFLVQALTWSFVNEGTTLVVLSVLTPAVACAALLGVRLRTTFATVASALLVTTIWAFGLSVTEQGVIAAFATVVAGGVIALISDLPDIRKYGRGPGLTGLAFSVVGLLITIVDVGWFSLSLLAAGSLVALAALADDRRRLGWVSASLFLVLLWVRLAEAEVVLFEAYTLPLVALLLAAGYAAIRRDPMVSSWISFGPGLSLGFGASAVAILADDGLVRPFAFTVAAVAVLGYGAGSRKQAPLTIGALALAFNGIVQLAPYAVVIPRWIAVGLVGVVLVTLGATYERRLRELNNLASKYDALK